LLTSVSLVFTEVVIFNSPSNFILIVRLRRITRF
jgi:hypothetical protein